MSIRKLQIGELLRRNISLVFQQEGHYIYGVEPLVTVTNVMVTPDLALAKVYLSVFNTEDKNGVMLGINHAILELKKHLYQRIRKQVRRVPDIVFYLDDTNDEVERVDNLFKKLYDENQMGSGEEE